MESKSGIYLRQAEGVTYQNLGTGVGGSYFMAQKSPETSGYIWEPTNVNAYQKRGGKDPTEQDLAA